MSLLSWGFALFFAFASWHSSDLYYPWLKFQSEVLGAVALLWVTLACWLDSRKNPQLIGESLGFFEIFLLALPLLAGGHALVNPEVYAGDAVLVALYALGAFIAMHHGRISAVLYSARGIEILCWLLLFSGVVSTAEALYQWFHFDGFGFWIIRLPDDARPSGNFAQANRMALHTAVGIAAVFFLNRRRVLSYWPAALVVCFLGLGVALSQSRAGWVSSTLILAFAVYFCRRQRRDMLFYGVLLIIVAFIFLALPAVSSALELGAIRTNRLALGSRTSLMLGFVDGVLKQPWWGYGPGQIVQVQVQRAAEAVPVLVSFWSHNIVLDIALLFGVPVAIALILVVLHFAFRLAKNLQDENNQFAFLAVVPFVVACNTEYPHAYMNSLLIFAYILGLVKFSMNGKVYVTDRLGISSLRGRGVFGGGVKLLVVLVFFGLGGVVVVDYNRLSYSLQVAMFEAARAGKFPEGYSYPEPLVLTNLQALIFMVRKVDFYGMNQQEIEKYRKAAFRNPYEPALRGYAVALGLNGTSENSKYSMESALTVVESFYGVRAKNIALRKIELLGKEMSESEVDK